MENMNLRNQKNSPVIAIFIFLALTWDSSIRAQYTLTDLNTLGAATSEANAINDEGQIIGTYSVNNTVGGGFIYSSGTGMVDLGFNDPTGINNEGQVVGNSINSDGIFDPFLYSSSSGLTNLSSVLPYDSMVSGINDLGEVVGYGHNSGETFSYTSSGGVQNLFSGVAYGVNNSGQIAGYVEAPQEFPPPTFGADAILYTPGIGVTDLALIYSFGPSIAFALNDAGSVVVGQLGYELEFGYLVGGSNQIVYLGWATPQAINDRGIAVGSAVFLGSGAGAFVYIPGVGEQYLNAVVSSLLVSDTGTQPGFVSLVDATGVNDAGEIVGYGSYYDGVEGDSLTEQAFLLYDPAAVPEPSLCTLLLLGLSPFFAGWIKTVLKPGNERGDGTIPLRAYRRWQPSHTKVSPVQPTHIPYIT